MGRYITTLIFMMTALLSLRSQWVQVPSGTTENLAVITAIGDAFYVGGTNGTFLRSFDQGSSFSSTSGFDTTACFEWYENGGFSHLSFYDELTGIGSTPSGCWSQITNDGGVTWTTYNANLAITMNDSDAVVFRWGAALNFSYPDGQLMHESDADVFADLDIICPPGGVCLYSIEGDQDTVAVNAGSRAWSLTSNDRLSSFSSGTFIYAYFEGASAEVISGDTIAYLSNWSHFLEGPNLLISHDKGVNWNIPVPYPFNPLHFKGMYWFNSNTCFATGPDGAIAYTLDGGTNWTMTTTPTTEHLNDIHFINNLQGWAVGENGTIIATSDGGGTWYLEESGVTADLLGIASDEGTVIIIGHNGTILRRDLTTAVIEHLPAPSVRISLTGPRTFTISSDHPMARVEILDATGRMIEGSRPGGLLMDARVASSGVHICRIMLNDGRILNERIIVP